GAVRGRPALRDRSQHGQARGLGGQLVRRRHVPADPRRLRLRRGGRHRAQVPRDAALPGGADLHEPDPHPRGHPRAGATQELLMASEPSYSTIKVTEPEAGITVITFARPEVANALSTAMGRELLDVWSKLRSDADLRVVILAGEGKHFQAGADLKERNGM